MMRNRVDVRSKEEVFCQYCGAKFNSGYHFTCHTCGESYCYIHMHRHDNAHPKPQHIDNAIATEADR
jgi:hypothetical protein